MCGSQLASHIQSYVYSFVVCLLGNRLPECSKKPQLFGVELEHYLVIFTRVRQISKSDLASSCLSACASVRMGQLGSHWTDFHEIWY
jgi:hypothetical protein